MKAAPQASTPPGSCPACGRYTGPALACPYCEVELPNRHTLQLLRWTSLVFASAGLIILLVIARQHPLPITPVSHITPARTERTRVRGITVTTPRIISQGGIPRFVSFDLDDGSGRITIAATRQIARTLVAENKLPDKGATIDVTGNPSLDRNRQLRLYMDGPISISSTVPSLAQEATL